MKTSEAEDLLTEVARAHTEFMDARAAVGKAWSLPDRDRRREAAANLAEACREYKVAVENAKHLLSHSQVECLPSAAIAR